MISRKQSIREKSDVINQYYKNIFNREPDINKNEQIRKKGKRRKLTKIKSKTKYRSHHKTKKKSK